MSKNSANANYQVGKEWREWMNAGGHYKSLEEGKRKQARWAKEEKEEKEEKNNKK